MRVTSINVVCGDASVTAEFFDRLGVDLHPTVPEWQPHHRMFATDEGSLDIELDSARFAGWWGGIDGARGGVVVNLGVGDRDEVDRVHRKALALGAVESKAPWDAFWGSRYSVVVEPGGVHVGFMSDADDARRSAPPSVTDFA